MRYSSERYSWISRAPAGENTRTPGERAPGDFGLNPLQFEITEELALKEIKHGRLAMWAVMGQIGAGLMTHEPAFGNLDKIFS